MRFATMLVSALCLPLVLAAQQASTKDVSGVWLGTLVAGPQNLRLQLQLHTGANGTAGCALDSLDQQAFGIACILTVKGDLVEVSVPAVAGGWKGTLAADGLTLTGTWHQGADLPLAFTRQKAAVSRVAPAQP